MLIVDIHPRVRLVQVAAGQFAVQARPPKGDWTQQWSGELRWAKELAIHCCWRIAGQPGSESDFRLNMLESIKEH
jgi:hypothetical protein